MSESHFESEHGPSRRASQGISPAIINAQANADAQRLSVKMAWALVGLIILGGIIVFFRDKDSIKEYWMYFGPLITACFGFLFGQAQRR